MKIVLTGAAGRLGSHLRGPLAALADELISSDIADSVDALADNERYVQADLAQLPAIEELAAGADVIVHFGAIGDEAPFDDILRSNIVGGYNVWEAARRQGVRRVVYASSIHAVGMHERTDMIGTDAPHRPDTYYGLAKCFCEDVAQLYWDKHRVESVCLRIASAAQVVSARSLGTWLSTRDLVQLVTRAIDTPSVGFTLVYGVSANDRSPFDNRGAAFLGYRPQDNAEQFAKAILADAPAEGVDDPAYRCIGGPFAAIQPGESGLAHMTIIDDE